MLALSVSASLVQRVAWMQATPELVSDTHGEGEFRLAGKLVKRLKTNANVVANAKRTESIVPPHLEQRFSREKESHRCG